jgi:acid stress-induced BolA-like protein IbaG/YrbA
MLSKKIKELLLLNFSKAEIYIKTVDEIHFEIIIIDDSFINIDIIDRHKSVYNIINIYILNKIIHAVSIKTYTFNEWKQMLKC